MDEGGPLLNQIMDNPVNNSVVAFGSAIGLAGLIMGNLWAYVDGLFDWFSIGVGSERYWAQYGRYPPNESVGTSAPKPASGPYGSR